MSSEFAAIGLDNLRRSLAFGGRRNIPSRPEVGLLLASWRVRSNLSKWTLKFSVPNCWPCLLQTDQNSQPLPVELPGGAVLSFPIDTFSVKKTHPVTFTLETYFFRNLMNIRAFAFPCSLQQMWSWTLAGKWASQILKSSKNSPSLPPKLEVTGTHPVSNQCRKPSFMHLLLTTPVLRLCQRVGCVPSTTRITCSTSFPTIAPSSCPWEGWRGRPLCPTTPTSMWTSTSCRWQQQQHITAEQVRRVRPPPECFSVCFQLQASYLNGQLMQPSATAGASPIQQVAQLSALQHVAQARSEPPTLWVTVLLKCCMIDKFTTGRQQVSRSCLFFFLC